ncbi:MAG TPA: GNAT family N-acetyltransferase, partial [Nitrososphaeraceae archaeon]|nr:GNAT family N-acetyltransferase [Nitrososphaeraceae archaeon]
NEIVIRKLQIEEMAQYLDILRNLAVVKTDLETARFVYEKEIAANPLHHIFIALADRKNHNKKVIASCTLLVEPKMIGNADRVGHIEDVVVLKEYQGMGIGLRIVDFVTRFGFEEMNCAKIELDCAESTMPFYQRLGYVYNDILMKKINNKVI